MEPKWFFLMSKHRTETLYFPHMPSPSQGWTYRSKKKKKSHYHVTGALSVSKIYPRYIYIKYIFISLRFHFLSNVFFHNFANFTQNISLINTVNNDYVLSCTSL